MRHSESALRRPSVLVLLLAAVAAAGPGCRGRVIQDGPPLHDATTAPSPFAPAEEPIASGPMEPWIPGDDVPQAGGSPDGSPDGWVPVVTPSDAAAGGYPEPSPGTPPGVPLPPPPPAAEGWDVPTPAPGGPGAPWRPGPSTSPPPVAGAGAGIPPPPPPPSWDSSRDRKVARDASGRSIPGAPPLGEPAGGTGSPPPLPPVDPGGPELPGGPGLPPDLGSPDGVPAPAGVEGPPIEVAPDGIPRPAEWGGVPQEPLKPKVSQIPSEAPVALSDDLGDAPAGGSRLALPEPGIPAAPSDVTPSDLVPPPARPEALPSSARAPVAPAGPPAPPPAAAVEDDPWITGGGTTPPPPVAPPAPSEPRPSAPPPVRPEPSRPPTRPPAPAAPAVPEGVAEDDPWITGGGTTPPPPVPPAPRTPVPSAPPADPFVSTAPPTGPGPALPPLEDQPPAGPAAPVLPPPGPAPEPFRPAPAPSDPTLAEEPPGPPVPGRSGFEFSGTPEQRAEEHGRRLLAAPEDPSIHGYPAEVVRRSDAAVALEPGRRPVAILFYDDTARASNLQAAEFLPVLARHRDVVDVVAVDVSSSAKWTPAEKRLVKSYYVAYVPTTVVLSADRKPLLLKYQRISGAVLDALLEKETRR